MSDIKAAAVARAVALLNAAGAQYKVLFGTEEYGDLVVAPPAAPRRNNPAYAHGERTAYIKAYLEGMKVGDVKTVPYGPYPAESFSSIVPPTAFNMWGKGSYKTQTTEVGVDVLRVL